MSDPIQFNDGAGYERFMGRWSRLAGTQFLDWLAPAKGWRWLDIGCGNGAFTELMVERCAPASTAGIDPSEAQLAFARSRPPLKAADFRKADAMALPFPDGSFDAAVMPLVIFFVPDPAKGVAEMLRVLRPGGVAAAYAWDMLGGGFPYEALHAELRAMGVEVPVPPSSEAAKPGAMRDYWTKAGFLDVEEREISVRREFESLEDYWATSLLSPSVGPKLAALEPKAQAGLKERLRERLPAGAGGRIPCTGRANAVKGRKR
ncbi:MAG: class I SAM-dependent methyltransferase [Elusimicrobia bacterium]|nr:class I SAM-dependent methyltransferase [Elusimicrobiota bacterium]